MLYAGCMAVLACGLVARGHVATGWWTEPGNWMNVVFANAGLAWWAGVCAWGCGRDWRRGHRGSLDRVRRWGLVTGYLLGVYAVTRAVQGLTGFKASGHCLGLGIYSGASVYEMRSGGWWADWWTVPVCALVGVWTAETWVTVVYFHTVAELVVGTLLVMPPLWYVYERRAAEDVS